MDRAYNIILNFPKHLSLVPISIQIPTPAIRPQDLLGTKWKVATTSGAEMESSVSEDVLESTISFSEHAGKTKPDRATAAPRPMFFMFRAPCGL